MQNLYIIIVGIAAYGGIAAYDSIDSNIILYLI